MDGGVGEDAALPDDGGGMDADGGAMTSDGGPMTADGGMDVDGGPPMFCSGALDDADLETMATLKPAMTDCDETGYNVDGSLDGDTDVDWFAIDATDELGCTVDPTVNTGAGVRVCLYARCVDGTRPKTTCLDGALPNTSPEMNPGCCRRSGGLLQLTANCPGIDEDVQLKISVSDGPVAACTPYTLAVHY